MTANIRHTLIASHHRAESAWSLSRLRTLFVHASVILALPCLVPALAEASAAFQQVWYPDGRIKYFIEDDLVTGWSAYDESCPVLRDDGTLDTVPCMVPAWGGAETKITDTMNYIAAHSPLAISRASDEGSANLQFRLSDSAPDGGGMTPFYWDENRGDSHQKIHIDVLDYDFVTTSYRIHDPSLELFLHEFGHALGMPHEFQRPDRDNHVDMSGCGAIFNWTSPYNYGQIDQHDLEAWAFDGGDDYYVLSPYDHASVMNDGYVADNPSDTDYPCAAPWPDATPQSRKYTYLSGTKRNPLSVHDINGIYRMYGTRLGTNDEGDRFGVAVATGDYDDDGYEDIVVANLQIGELYLEFFRGVDTDNSENVQGLKWVPWFEHEWGPVHAPCAGACVSSDEEVVLATGDFNGDGIDDLVLGRPSHDEDEGIVSIFFVNTTPADTGKSAFERSLAPWGRRGIQHQVDIFPTDVGITSGSGTRFGAAVAALRATNYRNDPLDPLYHDLAIGAPGALKAESNGLRPTFTRGAVAIVKGDFDETPANLSMTTHALLWNPLTVMIGAEYEFGAALSAVPNLCALPASTAQYNTDYLAVGDPAQGGNFGTVYLYGCATSSSSSGLVTPSKLATFPSSSAGRYGQALAGFSAFTTSDTLRSYLLVGKPSAMVGTSTVGEVSLIQIHSNGMGSLKTTARPGTVSGFDEFGYSLAVQQRASATVPGVGSQDVHVAVGMPGSEADGVSSGKVVVWRPFNSDGSINTAKVYIEPDDPSCNARFGQSLATLRNYKDTGGFVTGAPSALAMFDGDSMPGTDADIVRQSGQVAILQNGGDSYEWSSVQPDLELDQETESDKRPTN